MNGFIVHIAVICYMFNGDSSFFSTNYIGKPKAEIVKNMTESFKTFKLNTSNINKTYNYLKYEDKIQEITVLFFLSDENKCKMVRYMSDYSNINDVLEEINLKYSKIDTNNWKYNSNDKYYIVNLEQGDWFFTVTIKEMN